MANCVKHVDDRSTVFKQKNSSQLILFNLNQIEHNYTTEPLKLKHFISTYHCISYQFFIRKLGTWLVSWFREVESESYGRWYYFRRRFLLLYRCHRHKLNPTRCFHNFISPLSLNHVRKIIKFVRTSTKSLFNRHHHCALTTPTLTHSHQSRSLRDYFFQNYRRLNQKYFVIKNKKSAYFV